MKDVSNEMRTVRDKTGARIFSIEDFLSASQIASHFSRLCLLKIKRCVETIPEEAAEFEHQFDEISMLAKQKQ